MYRFLDRSVTSLGRGEYFLIWSMRSWVKAMASRQCAPSALGAAFARWGVTHALPHFHMAMVVLNREGLRRFSFAPLDYAHVSDDEALMLEMFSASNGDAADRVRETLSLIVAKGAIGTLFIALGVVAGHLHAGGLPLETATSTPRQGANEP